MLNRHSNFNAIYTKIHSSALLFAGWVLLFLFCFVCFLLQAKEKQEEIAMDMKMLEKILQDTQAQAVEHKNKKVDHKTLKRRHLDVV